MVNLSDNIVTNRCLTLFNLLDKRDISSSSLGCQIGHFSGQIKITNISFAAFGRRSLLW